MSKKEKNFVFQSLVDGVQTEIGRKLKGPGRPPVGPNIMNADDGNVYITGCLQVEPTHPSSYVAVEVDGSKIWYEKLKPVNKNVTKKYELVDGKLTDLGPAGRGRPAKGFVKIEDDRTIDGVNLKGHFYNDGEEEDTSAEVEETEVEDGYEEVEPEPEAEDEVDETETDLEAQAMADAAADFAADGGGEFEEVEFEEEAV